MRRPLSNKPVISSKLREYLTLANRLRQLVKHNRGDTEDADYIRDLMNDLWRGFSDDEAEEAQRATEGLDV